MMKSLFAVLLAIYATSTCAVPVLWQTNASGNDIHIYNLDDFSLVHRLEVGPNPHGIAVPKDSSVVYISLEKFHNPNGEILWINPQSLVIERRMDVCREPQNITVTPDNKWLYVPCKEGYFSVIDARSARVVKKIVTGGRPHNVESSSDSRYIYLASLGNVNGVTVVDVQANHEVAGFIPFGGQVRPLWVSEDGRRLFQQVDGVNGFRVADTDRQIVVNTVEHQTSLGRFRSVKHLINRAYRKLGLKRPFHLSRCHGLAARPDQEEIWSTCGSTLSIHSMAGENYPELAHITLDGTGYWVTFSPDSRYGAVAMYDRGQVAIVDADNKEIIRVLDAGRRPKRNLIIDSTITSGMTAQ